jgi:hypothetical protein
MTREALLHLFDKLNVWSRGDHWRHQPCGPGRSEQRRIAIPSVLVNAHLLQGVPTA